MRLTPRTIVMTRFHETQRFRQPWLWGLMLVAGVPAAAAMLYASYRLLFAERPLLGDRWNDSGVGVTLAFGVVAMTAVMGLAAVARLDVTVTDDEILIRFRPLHRRERRIAIAAIDEVHVRTYDPIREYGGWGIRMTSKGTAYNVSGKEGVQLVLADGRRILIGSQRSAELAAAITSSRRLP